MAGSYVAAEKTISGQLCFAGFACFAAEYGQFIMKKAFNDLCVMTLEAF